MKSVKKIQCKKNESHFASLGSRMRFSAFGLGFFGFVLTLCAIVLVPCAGCRQPGETAAEGHRRHKRVLRVNNQEIMADIDTALLLDKPSKLTERRIP
jgi:hypothetical protein